MAQQINNLLLKKKGCDSLKANRNNHLDSCKRLAKKNQDLQHVKLNVSQQCHCWKHCFHRNQNSLLYKYSSLHGSAWHHPSASSWDPSLVTGAGMGFCTSRRKVGWLKRLSWVLLNLKDVPGGASGEICALCCWYKKLQFNCQIWQKAKQ